MKRAWLGTALLAGSWLFWLDYFQPTLPAGGVFTVLRVLTWVFLVVAAIALLSPVSVRRLSRQLLLAALVLSVPALWLLPWPYKTIPLLLTAGLVFQLASLRLPWFRPAGQGSLAAALILLAQALTWWIYALGTARAHEVGWPLADLFGLVPRLWGVETAVDGSTLVMRWGEDPFRLAATWELLLDPGTVCCFTGGLVMFGLVFQAANPGTSWWKDWLKVLLALVGAAMIWAPLRGALLVALVLHRALRADLVLAPNVAGILINPGVHFVLLGGFLLLAIRWTAGLAPGNARESEIAAFPQREPRRSKPALAALLAGLGVALLVGLIHWDPVGQRLSGRVMVMEKHSTWEPTTEPYGTKVYGETGSYNYAALYAYCGQFFTMSRLLETEPIDDTTLRRCDVLVIKTPTSRYSADEVAALGRFVEQGGALLLIGDHTNVFNMTTSLNDISRIFGFSFRNDLLFRVGAPYFQPYSPPVVAHPIVQHLPPMFFAVSCSIDPGYSAGNMVIRSAGLWNLPPAYQEINYHPQAEYRPYMQYGAWCQLWSTTYGKGRVVAFADSTLFSNFCVFQPGKVELMMGMLEWLNHRSVLDRWGVRWLLFGPWALGGIFLLAASWWWARFTPGAGVLLVAAGLAGWTAGVLAVTLVHRWTMPVPPVQNPLTHVVIDRTLSDVPLFTGAFEDSQAGDGYGLLEQWIPRLGNFTSRQSGMEAFCGNALVLICPRKPVLRAYRQKLIEFAQAGGKVLILDSPDVEDSTANTLLEPFGLESVRPLGPPAEVPGKLRLGSREVPVRWSCRISGGEPLAWVGDLPVAARVRVGEGSVTALGFGSLFNDANMGYHWLPEPSAETRARYEVLYALLRIALE